MLSFSQIFYQAGACKRRYLTFLTTKLAGRKIATMTPNPCAARWNSWFSVVQYHSEQFGLYRGFIEMEIQVCGRSAPQSVGKLHEMLQDQELVQLLQIQLNIMADKCKVILQLLNIFQSRRPVKTKIFHYLEDLHMNIAANKELQYEACSHYFDAVDDLLFAVKTKILSTVEEAYSNAEEKLTK